MCFSFLPTGPEIPTRIVLDLEDVVYDIVKWLPRRQLIRLARTSKAWVRPCQAVIFRSITYSDNLLDILESSPHLTGLIHEFEIPLLYVVLLRITALSLPNLVICTLNWVMQTELEMNTTIPLAKSFVRRATLRTIHLHGRFFSRGSLNAVLAGCLSNIIALDVGDVSFSTDNVEDRDHISTTEPKLNPKSLVVGQRMIGWLSDGANPFNFTHLSILQLPSLRSLAIFPFPLHCVQDLAISKRSFGAIINSNISSMKSLRIVRFLVWRGPELGDLLSILRALPVNNQLEIVELNLDFERLVPRQLDPFRGELDFRPSALNFDAGLGDCPNLPQPLTVLLRSVKPPAWAELVVEVQQCFPCSGAKWCMDIAEEESLYVELG
ncbi:hypothetical protein B0H19DRAFT_1244544 [Mycena capillaripes]|nr:hypothetical protein B0H19DRAFT_1244544 [Mycena capillaripes]